MAYQKLLYTPNSKTPFRLSRSKIDLFLECPRCFYLDRRLGVSRPSGPGFSLNSAVDELLKKEFDLLRASVKSHALMKDYGLDAVPFQHPKLDQWRENFVGISYLHQPTNLEIFGAVDDIWINPSGELLIVDYKSTSTQEVISLESKYKQGYKKQMEVYQWLFKMNGFKVSPIGYFVFANADKNLPKFDGKLEFRMSIVDYPGNTSWVEPTIFQIHQCLNEDKIPSAGEDCAFCNYRQKSRSFE